MIPVDVEILYAYQRRIIAYKGPAVVYTVLIPDFVAASLFRLKNSYIAPVLLKADLCVTLMYSRDLSVRLSAKLMVILAALYCLLPLELNAQSSESTATLLGWEQRIRNFMLDRYHNYGGTYYNRGLFREHTVEMGPEHVLDLTTYRYTLYEDYDWSRSENAYRLTMGSLSAAGFFMENSIKNTIRVSSKGDLQISAYHAENLRAKRFLIYLEYVHDLGKDHYVGGNHTFTKEKSDLDATLYYRYGSLANGMLQLDITLMDWASNTVQELDWNGWANYNRNYGISQTNHQYENSPELLSLKMISPNVGPFKAELTGGVQTYSRKRVTENLDTLNYVEEEWAHYLGGLVEYSNGYLTAGLTYQRTFSKIDREPDPGSNYEPDFINRQLTNRYGIYGSGRYKSFRVEQWFWYEHNEDGIKGVRVPTDLSPFVDESVPFNYVEKLVRLKSGLYYDPLESGIRTGLEFHAEYIYPQGEKAGNGVRDFDFRRMYPIIKNLNERLTLHIGYRFSQNFYLVAGASYDLDADRQSGRGTPRGPSTFRRFDGGFGRLTISW